MSKEQIDIIGQATLFNTHVSDWGVRVNTFVNYLIVISGGVLTVTIGAFLSGSPPKLSPLTILAIRNGWYLLSLSLVLALCTTFLHIVAQAIVIIAWKKKLKEQKPGLAIIEGPLWFRIFIWFIATLAFVSCVFGVGAISYGASQLLS